MSKKELMEKRRQHLRTLLLTKPKDEIIDLVMAFMCMNSVFDSFLPEQLSNLAILQVNSMLDDELLKRVEKFMEEAIKLSEKEFPDESNKVGSVGLSAIIKPSKN